MQTSNEAALRRMLVEMDAGNLEIFDELCTSGYQYHAAGAPHPLTWEEHKESARGFYTTFSGFGHTLDDILAIGDKVVFRATDFGKHTGEFAGLPATGRDVRFRVTGIARFEDGKLAEMWLDVDWLTLFQQLGGVPPALIGQ